MINVVAANELKHIAINVLAEVEKGSGRKPNVLARYNDPLYETGGRLDEVEMDGYSATFPEVFERWHFLDAVIDSLTHYFPDVNGMSWEEIAQRLHSLISDLDGIADRAAQEPEHSGRSVHELSRQELSDRVARFLTKKP